MGLKGRGNATGTQRRFIIVAIVVTIFVLIVFTLAVFKFGWNWTGFTSSPKKTVTTEIIRSPQEKVTATEEDQPGKTLWDWLQLLGVLAIPIVVGFGTAFFTRQQAKTSEANAETQQQEELLRTYFDKISDLLLDKELSTNPSIQSIVRARTLAVLHILSPKRKAIVLRFLHDSNSLQYVNDLLYSLDLSHTDLFRIDLSKANLRGSDLSGANLRFAYLREANLHYAILTKADLREADLTEARLKGADLREADLREADLREADLREAKVTEEQLKRAKSLQGATMPDGSRHP